MQTLKKLINDKLVNAGFSAEDNNWTRIIHQQTGGSTMSINGQVFQQAGQMIEIKLIFSIVYDFDVEFLDTCVKENTIVIKYQFIQDGQSVCEYETNIYADEYQLFDELCNKIFGI
jgi:N-acetylglutamate synthase/N-acetylornithine aminotransferase